MKILRAFCIALVAYSLVSCEKTTDEKLCGKWQLRSYEGAHCGFHAVDSVFYNFDSRVFRLQLVKNSMLKDSRYGMYTLYGDSLYMELSDPAYRNEEAMARWYGWNGYYRRFLIRELSSRRLQLSCDDTLYSFRKF